ncbi:hypothetical protein ACFCP7_01450 [Paenibacillus elgii]
MGLHLFRQDFPKAVLHESKVLVTVPAGEKRGVYLIDSQSHSVSLFIDMKHKPRGPSNILIDRSNQDILYLLYNGVPQDDVKERERLLSKYDLKDIEPHISMWSIKENKQLKQFQLKNAYVQNQNDNRGTLR